MESKRPVRPPDPFIEVRVNEVNAGNGPLGLCVGYELGQWRSKQLVDHVMEWIPEFALREGELGNVSPSNMIKLTRRALATMYSTTNTSRRGEMGEILLHIALRQVFASKPAISKVYYKDGPNETVKGFDAVHVVENGADLELWLGEVKFYDDLSTAISHVVTEINDHCRIDYLRAEFAAIVNKIDNGSSFAPKLKKLLDTNTSLDQVFSCARIPVLLTYDSAVLKSHTKVDAAYAASFRKEILQHSSTFRSKSLPASVIIHLLLMPLKDKKALVTQFDEAVKTWQKL